MIGITETKLDGTIFDAEIYIEGYSIVRCDRDRKGEVLHVILKKDICFSTHKVISKKIKFIFVDLLLPKTKPISAGIVYRPPKDTNLLQLFAEILNHLNILESEIFAFGGMTVISSKMAHIC